EALAAHQQQRDDVAKVDLVRLRGPVEALEALDQQFVVDRRAAGGLAVLGDAAGPVAERPRRWAGPGVGGVVAADERAGLGQQGGRSCSGTLRRARPSAPLSYRPVFGNGKRRRRGVAGGVRSGAGSGRLARVMTGMPFSGSRDILAGGGA